MKLRIGSLAVGAVLTTACSLSAQTLVSWGPSADLMDLGTGASQRATTAGGLDFDLTTPITPLVYNSANGRTYGGGAYYGGITSDAVASMNAGVAIRNAAFGGTNYDAQIFGRATGTTVGYSATGVFLWKQQDFTTGAGATDNVTVTSLTYDALLLGGASTNLEARFVIQQGGSYMISSNIGLATYSQVHTVSDLSSVAWYSYAPAGRSIGSVAIGSEALSSVSFSGVTAVGLYLSGTSSSIAGGDAFILGFSQFAATGTVSAVPEPSAAAALIGFGALAGAALRRRKRNATVSRHE